jgi:hypothetical protein
MNGSRITSGDVLQGILRDAVLDVSRMKKVVRGQTITLSGEQSKVLVSRASRLLDVVGILTTSVRSSA